MGINKSKALANITTKIAQELKQSANASGTVQCAIETGNITLKNAKNCSVANENRCTADVSSAVTAISKAAAEAWSEASAKQKAAMLPGVNVNESIQNVEVEIKNLLEQKCQASASLTQEIATGDILIDGCENSNILNINAGSAVANCGIRTIMDTINNVETTQDTNQSGENLGDVFGNVFGSMFGSTFAIPIAGSLSSLSCLFMCLLFFVILFALM